MSWRLSNHSMRTPNLPGSVGDKYWINDQNDELLFYHLTYGWIIAQSITPVYNVKDSVQYFTCFYRPFGGVCFYKYPYGLYLWNDGYKWVISSFLGGGTKEEWVWNDEDDHEQGGYYTGDVWWSGQLPTEQNPEEEFQPRGDRRGNVAGGYDENEVKTLQFQFEYWKRKASQESMLPFGVYEREGEDDKVLGLLCGTDQNDETYVRSLEKSNGKYTYGSICYNGSKWVIGTIGSASGWWEGSEPQYDQTVNFAFKKPEGSEINGEDLSISFNKYVMGDNTEISLVCEAPIWL